MIKIYINNTHAKEENGKAFSKLNTLLLSKNNPYEDLFQTETLFLDDAGGFISIVPSSRQVFYSDKNPITYNDLKELADFIFDNVVADGELYLYIGEYLFRRNYCLSQFRAN